MPQDYIDTQGLSPKLSPEEKALLKSKPVEHKPMEIKPRRVHTDTIVKELKILINEVLDEREGKMDYVSYFDTEKFKYRVGEEEPPYKS
tara:strand:- start:1058 stop:1324 length:267 start_codon:yes stop_codon:yes gene_type:complete